jgi:hypothetical protein
MPLGGTVDRAETIRGEAVDDFAAPRVERCRRRPAKGLKTLPP